MKSFTNIEGDSNFRPYSAGMSNREVSMASIILLQNAKSTVSKKTENNWAYQGFRSAIGDGQTNMDTLDRNIEWLSQNSSVPNLDFGKYMSQKTKGTYYGVFNNFAVTSVSEAREELVRINLNFGGNWNAFFFGENPRVFTVQGLLLDSPEYPYYQEFLAAYDTYLSGRKAIANKMEVVMTYDGRIISGYLLKLVNENNAEQYNLKSFSFTILVKHDNWFRYNYDAAGVLGLNNMDNTNRYGKYQSISVAADQAEVNNARQAGIPYPNTAPEAIPPGKDWPPQIAPAEMTEPVYQKYSLEIKRVSNVLGESSDDSQ